MKDDNSEQDQIQDDAALVFDKHKDAVLVCEISPKGDLAISGGQDDTAYIWNLNSGEVVFQVEDHTDSVVAVGFNTAGNLVASADMAGKIQVFNLSKNNPERIFTYEVGDLNWISWHPQAPNVLLAGTECGSTWMWQVTDESSLKTFPSLTGASNVACALLPDGQRAVVGYADGSLLIWNLKSVTSTACLSHKSGHEGGVTVIDVSADGNLIASGGCDGTVRLINSNNGKVLATFECTAVPKKATDQMEAENPDDLDLNDDGPEVVPPPGEDDIEIEERDDLEEFQAADDDDDDEDFDMNAKDSGDDKPLTSVEGLAFCPTKPLLASVTAGGNIEIWDTNTHTKRVTCDIGGVGACRLVWEKSSSILFAACLDGALREVDGRSGEITAVHYGHGAELLSLSATSSTTASGEIELLALTASDDNTCRVFRRKVTKN